MRRALAPSIGLAAALAGSGSATAATLAFQCGEERIVYEGGEAGRLVVAAPYGAMDMPATRESGGAEGSFTIRAFGPAAVLMPDKVEMDACVAGNARPGDLDSSDAFSSLVETCRRQVHPGVAPVAVTADVEIVVTRTNVVAAVSRTYVAISAAIADHIPIRSRSRCTVGAG